MAIKIIIIGGGAAGLMAAIQAAKCGAAVTVLEKNDRPGKKLLATGNGRCNLTNQNQDLSCYRTRNPEMVKQVLDRFSEQDTLVFFEELGIRTKNRDGWIYPYSDQAQAVLDVLLLEAAYRKIKIKTREQVCSIAPSDGGTWLVRTGGWQYEADRVILCCGSPASAVAGSGADALMFADRLGIPCDPFFPALCPLKGKGRGFSAWAGVRIRGKITLLIDGVPFCEKTGELQLTDYGISGIPVFSLSRYAVSAIREQKGAAAELDFMPDTKEADLISLLAARRRMCPYKSMPQLLIGLVPDKLIPLLTGAKKTPEETVRNMKHYHLALAGQTDVKKGQVCSGGIHLDACSPDLEIKGHSGLYAAGEALDVDGDCGGYNLQWAWSSGALAGTAAAKED